MTAEFPSSDLPPLETAFWFMKPGSLVRGTWAEAKEAAEWIGGCLAEYGPRFAVVGERDPVRLARVVDSAAERLAHGGDTSFGCYLERPTYLSLAVVTCSPNRAAPRLRCPFGEERTGERTAIRGDSREIIRS